MKTVGFVDYYINEWHANNYVGWIREASKKLGEDFEVKYAWAELDKDPAGAMSTSEWCEKYGVTKCDTVDELCEKSDYVIVLAPSNPETHLRLATAVLKYGKRTYVDKTFAPDYDTAKKIFDIAAENGAKFFSSSALRYANELDEIRGAVALTTTGGGSNFDEYIIHQVEMLVKTLGCDAKTVRSEKGEDGSVTVTVDFLSGKKGKMVYSPNSPFTLDAQLQDGTSCFKNVDGGVIFAHLIDDILRFFLSGALSFDAVQTLAVSRIREAAIKSVNQNKEIALA